MAVFFSRFPSVALSLSAIRHKAARFPLLAAKNARHTITQKNPWSQLTEKQSHSRSSPSLPPPPQNHHHRKTTTTKPTNHVHRFNARQPRIPLLHHRLQLLSPPNKSFRRTVRTSLSSLVAVAPVWLSGYPFACFALLCLLASPVLAACLLRILPSLPLPSASNPPTQ